MNNRFVPSRRFVLLAVCTTSLLLVFSLNESLRYYVSDYIPTLDVYLSSKAKTPCPATAYAEGQWTQKVGYLAEHQQPAIVDPRDALKLYGFEGCASDREFLWHLGTDHDEQWIRFPNVSSWEWTPPARTCDLRKLVREEMVRDLVEQGGWLLLGDSIMEGHFFSLSCILYPHVRATPNYTENPYFDRAWPQNLYLNPESSLIPTLKFPKGFSIENTPLVTFRRNDLLLSKEELNNLYSSLHPHISNSSESNFTLFSEERTWTLSPSDYMPIFLGPNPEANYGTLIVATAGHWTTTLLATLADKSKEEGGQGLRNNGIDNVLSFFGEAMTLWATEVQEWLVKDRGPLSSSSSSSDVEAETGMGPGRGGNMGRKRRVIARAYLPGHENCHAPETYVRGAVKEIVPFTWTWYNWNQIGEFNDIFQSVLSSNAYPDIHYLPIDRPGLLRPDAHASGDCLHILTGPGVMEGWSHYIWHYITREI